MKYKTKTNLIEFFMLLSLWFINNYSALPKGIQSDNINLFYRFVSVTSGYNNSVFSVGVVITLYFIFSFFSNFKRPNESVILRCGRDRFVLLDIKNALIHSCIFAFEYWAISTVLTTLFCDIDILKQVDYLKCSILYFITRLLYFVLVGMILEFIKLLMNFKKYYVLVAGVFILGMNSLPYFGIEKSIPLFANFVGEWISEGTFNVLEYVKNSLICIILSAIMMFLSRILFLKKDILSNEEED